MYRIFWTAKTWLLMAKTGISSVAYMWVPYKNRILVKKSFKCEGNKILIKPIDTSLRICGGLRAKVI